MFTFLSNSGNSNIGPDGSLYIDNTKYEVGELFYQRSWEYGLPQYLGTGIVYRDFGLNYNFYSSSLPWKQELANLIDFTMGSEMGTTTVNYQRPEAWNAECYINESQERSWEIDRDNVIHITIRRN